MTTPSTRSHQWRATPRALTKPQVRGLLETADVCDEARMALRDLALPHGETPITSEDHHE
jgi:hypothetical protein